MRTLQGTDLNRLKKDEYAISFDRGYQNKIMLVKKSKKPGHFIACWPESLHADDREFSNECLFKIDTFKFEIFIVITKEDFKYE